jgi:hypothetical protein
MTPETTPPNPDVRWSSRCGRAWASAESLRTSAHHRDACARTTSTWDADGHADGSCLLSPAYLPCRPRPSSQPCPPASRIVSRAYAGALRRRAPPPVRMVQEPGPALDVQMNPRPTVELSTGCRFETTIQPSPAGQSITSPASTALLAGRGPCEREQYTPPPHSAPVHVDAVLHPQTEHTSNATTNARIPIDLTIVDTHRNRSDTGTHSVQAFVVGSSCPQSSHSDAGSGSGG